MSQTADTTTVVIGKRIEYILKHAVYFETEECYFTSSIDTARRAEQKELIEIVSYRGKNFSQRLSKQEIAAGTIPLGCFYKLTDQGQRLRDQLLSGTFTNVTDQRDQSLSWLLNQAAGLHFTQTPEIDSSYSWDTEDRFLVEIGNQWLGYSVNKLGIPPTNRYLFIYNNDAYYHSAEIQNGLFSEAVTVDPRYQQIDITVSLLSQFRSRYPVTLTVSLNVHERAREFFRRALADYPGILADIIDYPRCLNFECSVPLATEPPNKRAAQPMEWLKAYFAPNEYDDEEHFWLTTDFAPDTSKTRIRRTFLSIVALYESAIQSDLYKSKYTLLDYHRALGLRK